MSFLGNLFNWTSPPADSGCGARGSGSTPPPSYSFEKLQQLYNRLAQFRESDLEKSGEGDALIETVRQITEALIWGEQANHSQFFDFFCEKSIFSDLVHVLGLKKASKKVKLQLLQTLSMLIQNIHRQTSVYYILSNNHVNKLMSTNMDFDDEEVLAYYITLMKSLAMRLDNESIKFFFIQHPEPSFPLYIEATKFFSHRDHMVRATVRTITLQVYKIEDQPMRRFVLRHAAESYFSQLAYHLQDLWLRLDAAAAKATGEDNLSQVQRENELQQDLQIYLSDVFELGIEELNEVLADRLLNAAILPVLLAGLTTSSSHRVGGAARTLAPHVSLFLVRQVLDTFHCPVLLEPMAQALLWSSVPAALAYVMVKILANGDIVPDNDPRAQASVTQRRPPTAKASATPPPNPPSTASGAGAGAGGGGFAGDVGDGENVIVGDLARACGIYGRTVQVMDREVPMIYLIVAGVLALLWISGNTNAIRMGVFAFMLYVMYTQYTKAQRGGGLSGPAPDDNSSGGHVINRGVRRFSLGELPRLLGCWMPKMQENFMATFEAAEAPLWVAGDGGLQANARKEEVVASSLLLFASKRRQWSSQCGDPRLDAVASTPSKEEDYMGPEVSNVGRGYDGEQGNINAWSGEEQLSPPQKEPESETTPIQASFEPAAAPEAGKRNSGRARSTSADRAERAERSERAARAVPVIAAKPSTASGEDFETATGLSLVRTKLERCMLKDHELPLSDVLQAKVCAIRAMAEATVAYKFENAKQLKNLRDTLPHAQSWIFVSASSGTALWARLIQVKELHQAISARVSEAVEVEDFSKAEEVYELQKLAEDCLKGFELDERQGGSADLTAGAISLGPASSLGLLEGDFTVEFWMRCHVDVSARTPLLTGDPSLVGSFPSLYVKPGGGLQLDFAGGNSYSSRMRLQQTKKWMHVAISYSFSPSDNDFKVSLFQDGLQVEFGSEIWAVNMDSELRLGPFPGKLAEFRVWDHARAADEVELWMTRRCQGDEPGLCCCLSLRPSRGLSDSTLDPGKALASGHFFADRGAFDGPVTWDGDCPSLLDDPAEDESVGDCRECGQKYTAKQARPDVLADSDPWSNDSLLRAWEWLDSSHETKVVERRREAERRQLESEARQVEERQRKEYLHWQEQQRQQEELELKRREDANLALLGQYASYDDRDFDQEWEKLPDEGSIARVDVDDTSPSEKLKEMDVATAKWVMKRDDPVKVVEIAKDTEMQDGLSEPTPMENGDPGGCHGRALHRLGDVVQEKVRPSRPQPAVGPLLVEVGPWCFEEKLASLQTEIFFSLKTQIWPDLYKKQLQQHHLLSVEYSYKCQGIAPMCFVDRACSAGKGEVPALPQARPPRLRVEGTWSAKFTSVASDPKSRGALDGPVPRSGPRQWSGHGSRADCAIILPMDLTQAAEHCGCSEDDLCPIAGIDESAKVRSIFDGSQGGANSTLASKHLKALTSAGALRPEPLGHGAALLRICYSVFPQMDWGFVFSDDFAWLLRKSNSKLMATAICPHLPVNAGVMSAGKFRQASLYVPLAIWAPASDASASDDGSEFVGGWLSNLEKPAKGDVFWFRYQAPCEAVAASCLGLLLNGTGFLYLGLAPVGARMPIEKAAEMVREVEQNLQSSAAGAADQVRGNPPCPQVPHRFAAQMTFLSTDSGYPAKGPGFFAQDVDLKAMRMETIRPFLGKIKGVDTNLTMLSIGNHSWDLTGGNQPMCRVLPMFGNQRFHDMFAWAANPALAEYVGPHVVAGHSCDLWRFRFGSKTLNQTLCADGNIPVELVISINNSSGTTVKKLLASYQFSQVTSQVDQTLLEKPSICDSLAPPCENGRDVGPVTVDAYVFHPGISAVDYNIEDQNVADLRGDALFICMDCLQNQSSFIDHNYTRISRYTLQMSPAFGQYALCNGYPDTVPPGPECLGGDPRLVGKEAPFFAGDGESRCSADSSIGFWYGLPKAGHCSAGEVPKKGAWESGCTWSILKRHKTIKQTCLLNDHHYLTFCQADFKEGKGFPRSEAALLAAFSSEDPSKGGCADIGGFPERLLVSATCGTWPKGRSGTPEDLAATGARAAGSPNDPRLPQDVSELDMPIFKDRTFLLAVSVVHCCAVKRKVFSHEFLATAQLLPKQHEPKGSQSRSKASSGTPELPKPLSLLFQAIPGRLNWQPKPYMALVRMLLEVVHAEAMPPFAHAAAHKVASTAMQAAASQVRKVLQEAQCAEDAGAWLVDVFCEEWEQHKAGLPHLPEFFADPRRLAPPEGAVGVGRRSSMQRPSIVVAAQHAVRSLLMCRRLVRSLPGAVPKAEEQPGGPQWLRYSNLAAPACCWVLVPDSRALLRQYKEAASCNSLLQSPVTLSVSRLPGAFAKMSQEPVELLSAGIPQEASAKCTLLLKKCVKLLETFNPKVTTVDAYMDDAKFLEDPMIGDVELKFIHQAFYGCHRYGKLLKLFVTSFAFRVPAIAVRSEQSLYQVLAYLLFFRLDEMGLQDFRKFIFCGYGSPPAIFALMQYALDREELNNWVMQEWLKHYDPEYLDEDVLGKLHRRAEDLKPMMEEIQLKATGVAKSGGQRGPGTVKSDKKLTEFEPFNLTAVKPRLIPEPESSVLKDLTAHPAPAHINRTSLAAIEEARKRQREEEKARVAAKYSVDDEFIFETAGRRDHETIRMQLQEDADKKTMAECTFQPKSKKRIMPAEDATVRQNTTQVLREDARVRQTMLAEHDLLKQYEAELHDASEFYAWQDRMRKKDFLEEEARTKERIIQTQLARDVAAEAHEAATRMKSIQAEFQKKDLQVQLEAKEREYEADLEQKQKVVEQTTEDREKARIAEQEVLVIKQEHAEQRRREKEVDLAKKKKEEDYEMERKKELIRQIRALERAPRETAKVFDRAEAPAQGFLEEMSFAELKERLIVMQEQHERRVEAKRERQLAKKAEKESILTEKVQLLARVREQAKEHLLESRDHARKQRVAEEAKKDRHREDVLIEVAARLESKKKEKKEAERRLRKELQEIATKQQFQLSSQDALEAKQNADQVSGLNREVFRRQDRLLTEQRKQDYLKARAKDQLKKNVECDHRHYLEMQDTADRRTEKARRADTAFKNEVANAYRHARDLQHSHENKHIDMCGHSANAYWKSQSKLDKLASLVEDHPTLNSISCSMATKKVQRQLLLDPTWLILAEPDVGSDSSSTVTTVWPIWQVQSLIDRSDPRTLQIGMNAHKPGMRPGEAIAYNPPVCTYFTLTLNFDDVKKCNEAAVHLQTRRRVVRGQMLQKAASFFDQCQAGLSSELTTPFLSV
ncbi:CLEC16A [Symbiodinium sp. KB8]|nr:CLEC16A [Symbiodinium sp. KB8]